MPKLIMDWPDPNSPVPQRGDVLAFPKTDYRVFGVRKVKRRDLAAAPRYSCFVFREVEVDTELKQRLNASAFRRGGPIVFTCHWNKR